MASAVTKLDHVILLLPYESIINPPSWLTDHFTISPGGRHADGKTENRLVLFSDGTYLEIIAFINDDPEKRKGHWWDKPYGIVDYALTTSREPDFDSVNARLSDTGTGISYAKPVEGGRKRPDGVELKWKVTFPQGTERGSVPFWCHDVTPRQRRVPVTDEAMKHPCGALGMAGVQVEVDSGRVSKLSRATGAIVGSPMKEDNRYSIGVPSPVDGSRQPTVVVDALSGKASETLQLALVVQTPQANTPADIRHPVGVGVVNILFEKS